MTIKEYKHDDLLHILDFDGRASKRREAKFRLVETCPETFYCYVAQDKDRFVGFIIMEDLADGINDDNIGLCPKSI